VESVLSLAATLLGSEPLPSSPPHPEWLERAVLEAWAAAPGASGMARGRGFLGVARATRSRWRGPIQALFELEAAVVGVPPRPLARLRATVRRGLDRLRGRD
jgi:hypothetical protein